VIGSYGERRCAIVSCGRASNVQAITDEEVYIVELDIVELRIVELDCAVARRRIRSPDVTVRVAASGTRARADRTALRQPVVEHFGFDRLEPDRLRVPAVAERR
jgi:hypothetical protein